MSDGQHKAPGFRIGASFKARFDPSGARLVTLGRRITLWDVAERRRVGIGPPLRHASAVDLSPDGQLVAAKNTSGEVLVLRADDPGEMARVSGRGFGEGAEVRFAPGGNWLVDATWDGRLLVRDPTSGHVEWEERDADGGIVTLTCSRDRELWAYTRRSHEGTRVIVRTWPFSQYPALEIVTDFRVVWAIALSDAGDRVTVSTGGSIRSFALPFADADPIACSEFPSGGSGEAIAWSPDGTWLAQAGGEAVRVFDRAHDPIYERAMTYPSDVDVSADGTLLAVGDWSRGVVLPTSNWPPRPTSLHRGRR